MKFLRKILNVKISKVKLESLTNVGIQDISHELFQLGLIHFSSPEKSIVEEEKRSFISRYDESIISGSRVYFFCSEL